MDFTNNPQTKRGNDGRHLQKKKESPQSHGCRDYTQRTYILSILKVGKESELALLEGDISGNGAAVDVVGP